MSYIDKFKIKVPFFLTWIVMCCLTLSLLGCNSMPIAPLTPNSVQFIDYKLEKHLIVSNLSVVTTSAGNLKLNAQIQNTSRSRMILEINTDWFDDNFSQSEPTTEWKRVVLQRNETFIYSSIATNQYSQDFVLNIRNGGA